MAKSRLEKLAYFREYNKKRSESKRLYYKKRRALNPEQHLNWGRAWALRNPDKVRESARKKTLKRRGSLQIKAKYRVKYAVKTGKLVKAPCMYCGEIKVQAHHNDYLKPLDVKWLCNAHHKAWHRVFIPENTSGYEIPKKEGK